jgi:hypothetical protein
VQGLKETWSQFRKCTGRLVIVALSVSRRALINCVCVYLWLVLTLGPFYASVAASSIYDTSSEVRQNQRFRSKRLSPLNEKRQDRLNAIFTEIIVGAKSSSSEIIVGVL